MSNKNGQLEIKDKYEYGLGRLKTGFETTSKQDSIKIKPKFSFGMENIPITTGMTANFKITDENARVGVGTGNSNTLYAEVYGEVNWEKGNISVGGEIKFCKHFSTDVSAGYNFSEDTLNLKLQFKAFGVKINLIEWEFKDIAHNTIGRCLDSYVDSLDVMYKSISLTERERQQKAIAIKNKVDEGIQDIEALKEIININGENEKIKSIESSYHLQRGVVKYFGHLENNINQNRNDIERHYDLTKNFGIRLGIQEGRIIKVENRLSGVENSLIIHDRIIHEYERRINRMETIFNIHENRLNEHDRILTYHDSLIQNHTEILNFHTNILNQLDKRMYNIENNIVLLKEGINLNSKIISSHEERIRMQHKDIQELFKITNYQQTELKIQNEKIFEHQKAIVNLIYDYNNLKNKVENDEKVLYNLGETISKVINYAANTQSIVDGLCYTSQLHDNLIFQNHNDIIELKKEIENQRDYLLSRNEILKDLIKEINHQGAILRLHDESIKNLENFMKNADREIKNIYKEIPNLKKMIEKIKNEKEQIVLKNEIDEKNDLIDEEVKKLKEIISGFNKNQIAYFMKCIYISLHTGNFSFYKIGEIIKQLIKFNV